MQNNGLPDTIAAIATAEGAAGVAVVRISGPAAWQVAGRVLAGRPALATTRRAGQCFHARFTAAESGEVLDDGVVLLFRGPASFTGEDVVELQGHGNPVLVRAVLRAVLYAGARLAEPGEFTRRAFLNGKVDLTQAEAVMDLVHAQSERAARAARAQLTGQLGATVAGAYQTITALCADVAAQLDFAEDEVPAELLQEARQRVARLLTEITTLLQTSREGHLLRAGALVVLGGCPNAGKSSLLNALLGSNRAIVSPTAGTTRDTLEEGMVLSGIPIRLVDTAGLRETDAPLEREGVVRAHQALQQADLILHILDASRPLAVQHPHLLAEAFRTPSATSVLLVWNKCDLPSAECITEQEAELRHELLRRSAVAPVRISALTGTGLEELRRAMTQQLGLAPQGPVHATVSERHRAELVLAAQALERASQLLAAEQTELVLAATELRQGTEALGRILGRTYTQDLLDQIFTRFCLGK